MKDSHTPGPWRVLPEEAGVPYIRIRGTRLGLRFKIANVPAPSYKGAEHIEAEETQANASLIAAAPELLEALQLIAATDLQYVNPYAIGWMRPIVESARAAIAKATGAA